MAIGSTIAALRKKLGFTQEQLGEAVGVSGQAVSKWENGGAPDTVYAISENDDLIPLLMMARWIAEGPDGAFFLSVQTREDPILKELIITKA